MSLARPIKPSTSGVTAAGSVTAPAGACTACPFTRVPVQACAERLLGGGGSARTRTYRRLSGTDVTVKPAPLSHEVTVATSAAVGENLAWTAPADRYLP